MSHNSACKTYNFSTNNVKSKETSNYTGGLYWNHQPTDDEMQVRVTPLLVHVLSAR